MQKWRAPHLVGAVLIGFVLAGCERPPQAPDEPMSTTGPNQVVIKVPGMT
jgi:hypothetical protein